MRRLLFAVGLAFVAQTAFAQSNVTVDSSIQWANISSAASYQCKLQDGGGFDLDPIDPATNDPDGDKIVDVPENASGTTTVSLTIWLTGRGLGNYTFSVRSVDSNGNSGAWGVLGLIYVAPPPPTPTVASVIGAMLLYQERDQTITYAVFRRNRMVA